ncbi:shikimate dehydrogenase [Arthrobacter sp. KK5.5]|uniref:shikimate dehydrogenase n=1 Tax=Arthrobacter sp. KK5.5 TaxID=3373084 RepID=UPI003EE53776
MTPSGRAAVFGQPIGHSKSPALHGAAYASLGLDISYSAVEAGQEDAPTLSAMLRSEPGWLGASVTMPLKRALVPFMDSVSERVSRLGTLNTIVVDGGPDGVRLHGENTDVDGVVRALADLGLTSPGRIAILGAGGTATAATAAAHLLGAHGVDFVVRSAARAAECVELARSFGLEARALDAPSAGARMGEYDAVVSTLPAGAADGLLADLRVDAIRPDAALLDVVYDPWPTKLAEAWSKAGGRTAGGLSMLVHQAVEQVRLFSGGTEDQRKQVTNVMCDAVGVARPVR